MKRISVTPRPLLAEIISKSGFDFATGEGESIYWDETACYGFTLKQIENDIEAPTNEIAALCIELVERAMASDEIFLKFDLPMRLQDLARESWQRQDKTLYGRFDLSYDGAEPAKLLEYNADTPTSLFEAAVFQWGWIEDAIASRLLPSNIDQFNSIHDSLVEQWRSIASGMIHLASMDDVEDESTIRYLARAAEAAGLKPVTLHLNDIGHDGLCFIDNLRRPIKTLFKLYPWEWMIEDEFATCASMRTTTFLEPAWKALLSSKAILPLLWEMEPNHPNLLAARFSNDPNGPDLNGSFIRKRLRSREGSNITLFEQGQVIEETSGSYVGRSIDQALKALPTFAGNRPVIGSWVIGTKSCGIGIRESRHAITTNSSRFVPHIIM